MAGASVGRTAIDMQPPVMKPGHPQSVSAPTAREGVLVCDRVVFTSVRSPTGEGYRIIAASKDVRPEEKQAITRLSPSHDSICDGADRGGNGELGPFQAVAMYSLPTGRICLAASMYAGDEHTGRGGKRIYTINLLFQPQALSHCGFSPFAVLRTLASSEAATPQLKLPPVLPPLELSISSRSVSIGNAAAFKSLTLFASSDALLNMFGKKECLVPMQGTYLECAELLLAGLPGPFRCRLSFSAGLRFSTSRRHQLMLTSVDSSTKSRLAGSAVYCVDPALAAAPSKSHWMTFVELHWSRGDLSGLMRRTSRPFADCGMDALNRMAALYNQIDALDELSTEKMLELAVKMIEPVPDKLENETRGELVDRVRQLLRKRFSLLQSAEAGVAWAQLAPLFQRASAAATFAAELVEPVLRVTADFDPPLGVRRCLEMVDKSPTASTLSPGLQDHIAARLAEWWQRADSNAQTSFRGETGARLRKPGNPFANRLASIIGATASA